MGAEGEIPRTSWWHWGQVTACGLAVALGGISVLAEGASGSSWAFLKLRMALPMLSPNSGRRRGPESKQGDGQDNQQGGEVITEHGGLCLLRI